MSFLSDVDTAASRFRDAQAAMPPTLRQQFPVEYKAWSQARTRCGNGDPDYGGRGIEMRFRTFEAFLTEVGSKPSPELSLDRIDNDGHYEPGNVRWATQRQQSLNRRSTREGVSTPMDNEKSVPLLSNVEEAAVAYHEAEAALVAARTTLYAMIVAAAREGIPAARIGRSAGLSRERVRQIVEAHEADQARPTST
jgi:hypothetical protein